MEKSFASALAPIPPRKAAARTALVDLHESSRALLAECFRQFNIETVVMSSNAAERMRNEKFEACVLHLSNGAEDVMDSARTSRSNSRCVIYGVGGNAQEAMRYSKYGINAMFHEPLERSAALKLVRATQMLVLHEFRRYARIPIMTEVAVTKSDRHRFNASSLEVSSGGMSLTSAEDLAAGANVEVSFALLTLPRVHVKGAVTWRKGKSFGIRFDATDERRLRLKHWIDGYLES
ncbi:MAG: PilZ domain-containing protein [Acidobacteriia bacterium]|nr:PilZ domain-containing protein [Terriglobia bacterium]